MLRLLKFSHAPAAPPVPKERTESVDPLQSVARKALSGDREAQRTLFVMVGPAQLCAVRGVIGVAHQDVEDVLQEAMVALYGALAGFRGECRLQHFASRIAVQVAMNARRRARYRAHYTPSAEPAELAELGRDERSPADTAAAAERRAALGALLDDLPLPKAEVLALHVVLGYSVAETAAATGVPVNTVRSRLRSALAELRERIHGSDELFELLERKP